MILRNWDELPEELKTDSVKEYYDILNSKKISLIAIRIFDIIASSFMLIVFSPVFLILAIAIKADSKGPVFYRQTRVTQYNREFKIFKFRSMVQDADKGSLVTVSGDMRITKTGRIIRKYRLDEISQLINVFLGDMTFVGTRPEVPKYVKHYSEEMMATLLLPAGVTSLASIYYKDEARLLKSSGNADEIYVKEILPVKMYYNLKEITQYGFFYNIKILFMTVFAVLGKEYSGDYETEIRIENTVGKAESGVKR